MKVVALLGLLMLAGCAHQPPAAARPDSATVTAPRAGQECRNRPAAVESSATAQAPSQVPPLNPSPPSAPASVKSPPAPGVASRPPKPAPGAGPARLASSTAPPMAQSPRPVEALDLSALEQRLRDTRAIGVFTKLSLKNQVDDLLDTVREYHSGQHGATLQDAKQRYDELLLKVLSLLKDGDPALASSIRGSREAIWNLLADRDQFQKMHL